MPKPTMGAHESTLGDDSVEARALKFYRDPDLPFGDMLLAGLKAGGVDVSNIKQSDITLAQIQQVVAPRSLQGDLSLCILTILMQQRFKRVSGAGVEERLNKYRVAPQNLSQGIFKLNEYRKTVALPKLDTSKEFIAWFEEPTTSDALLNSFVDMVMPGFKQSGQEQTKQAVAYVSKGIVVLENREALIDLARTMGETIHAGLATEQTRQRKAANLTHPERTLEPEEFLLLASPANAQLLHTNLALLKDRDAEKYGFFNKMTRRIIDEGVNMEERLRTTLIWLAVALRNNDLPDQADILLQNPTVMAAKFEDKVFAKDNLAKAKLFILNFVGQIAIAGSKINALFGGAHAPIPVDPTEIRDVALEIDGALATPFPAPGDLVHANEQQRRLARRVAKVMAGFENIQLVSGTPDDPSFATEKAAFQTTLFARHTKDITKLTNRLQPESIETKKGVTSNKTYRM